ncbi:hypothetical protein ANCCAN_25800 [Ancylostoma caninum]|uniref:Uncharacterized protein n=1 Tax=Ancylostoma caninum TaxID=29170 RepID=A0A368F8E9_ANCCA|nr:hypothetical protein ANCCAN_25800 [Ancylostoma caninum]
MLPRSARPHPRRIGVKKYGKRISALANVRSSTEMTTNGFRAKQAKKGMSRKTANLFSAMEHPEMWPHLLT